MSLREEQERISRTRPQQDLESPFSAEDLFVEESGSEWEARLTALEIESPFQRAFEQGPNVFAEPEELAETFDDEDEWSEVDDYLDDEAGIEDELALAELEDDPVELLEDWADSEEWAEVYAHDEAPYDEEAAYPPEEVAYEDEEQFLDEEFAFEQEGIWSLLSSSAIGDLARQLFGGGLFGFTLLSRFAAGQIWNEDYLALEVLFQRQPELRPAKLDTVTGLDRLRLLRQTATRHRRKLEPIRERIIRPVFSNPANFQIGPATGCHIVDLRSEVSDLGPLRGGERKSGGYWYKKNEGRSPRKLEKIDSIVLHHMAYNIGNDINLYKKVGAHYIVTADGQIAKLYDDLDFLNSSNGFNKRCVAIEFAGNFSDHRYRWWKSRKRRIPDRCYLTPVQIRAGRCLLADIKRRLPGVQYLYAHRQSSSSRSGDPGPDVWFNIAEWAMANLNLTDKWPQDHIGGGRAIPDIWRTSRPPIIVAEFVSDFITEEALDPEGEAFFFEQEDDEYDAEFDSGDWAVQTEEEWGGVYEPDADEVEATAFSNEPEYFIDPEVSSDSQVVFPSGVALRVLAGLPEGKHEDYWDPSGSDNPLLDTGPDHKDKKLSPNFSVRELTTSRGRSADIARIDPEFVRCLQNLRDHVGKAVKITSGYRSWKRNKEVYAGRKNDDGTPKKPTLSQHCGGRAADIKIAGMNGLEIGKAAIEVCGPNIGVGLGRNFAHIDIRGYSAAWNYGGAKRSWVAEIKRLQKERGGTRKRPSGASRPRSWPSASPAQVRLSPNVIAAIEQYRPLVEEAAAKYGVDSALIRGVIAAESGGNKDLVAKSGYTGLMQADKGESQKQAKTSIDAGTKKLRDFRRIMEGVLKERGRRYDQLPEAEQLRLLVLAYNAGPVTVAKALQYAAEAGNPERWLDAKHYKRALLFTGAYSFGQAAELCLKGLSKSEKASRNSEAKSVWNRWRLKTRAKAKRTNWRNLSDPPPWPDIVDSLPSFLVCAIDFKHRNAPKYAAKILAYRDRFQTR